jgi:hypothetical protein
LFDDIDACGRNGVYRHWETLLSNYGRYYT